MPDGISWEQGEVIVFAIVVVKVMSLVVSYDNIQRGGGIKGGSRLDGFPNFMPRTPSLKKGTKKARASNARAESWFSKL